MQTMVAEQVNAAAGLAAMARKFFRIDQSDCFTIRI
jgi:hypothetical protein